MWTRKTVWTADDGSIQQEGLECRKVARSRIRAASISASIRHVLPRQPDTGRECHAADSSGARHDRVSEVLPKQYEQRVLAFFDEKLR